MALSNRQADNLVCVGAGKLPAGYGFLAEQASLEKNVNWHGERKIAALDMHSPAPDCVVRHFLDKRWQRHSDSPDTHTNAGDDARLGALIQINSAGVSTNGSSLSQGDA